MLLVNSLLGSDRTVSGGFALTDCGALSFLLFPPFPCLYLMYLYMSSVFVLLKGSFRSLQVTVSSFFDVFPSLFFTLLRSDCVCVCLILALLCFLGLVSFCWLQHLAPRPAAECQWGGSEWTSISCFISSGRQCQYVSSWSRPIDSWTNYTKLLGQTS